MPKLTVEGVGEFEVPAGKRLVNALVDECGVDQLHACGGVARCTTCRVEFVAGEPAAITNATRSITAAGQGLLFSVGRCLAGGGTASRTEVASPSVPPWRIASTSRAALISLVISEMSWYRSSGSLAVARSRVLAVVAEMSGRIFWTSGISSPMCFIATPT